MITCFKYNSCSAVRKVSDWRQSRKKDNIKIDLEDVLCEVVDWAYLPQDRDQCLTVVNTKRKRKASVLNLQML